MSDTHAEWLERQINGSISELGRRVALILGITWKGIYHLPPSAYFHKRTDWKNERHIRVCLPDYWLATWDFNHLTVLVTLAHNYCVRMQLSAAGKNHVFLDFYMREREGSMSARHPTIDQAIEDLRSYSIESEAKRVSLGEQK